MRACWVVCTALVVVTVVSAATTWPAVRATARESMVKVFFIGYILMWYIIVTCRRVLEISKYLSSSATGMHANQEDRIRSLVTGVW
ncbi:hypothetical protein D3C78_1410440 [compost metagenome]